MLFLCVVVLGLLMPGSSTERGSGSLSSNEFFPGRQYPVGDRPEHFSLGDLDADGFADAVVVDRNESEFHVLINDRVGGFRPATAYFVGERAFPNEVRLGDMDRDGDLDVVLTHSEIALTYSLSVFLNDGLGAFVLGSAYDAGYEANTLMLGDLDGDADLDVVVSGTGGPWRFLNAGDATLNSKWEIPFAPSSIVGMSLGDLDGDSDLDLMWSTSLTNSDPNDLYVQRNDGHGYFGDAEGYLGRGGAFDIAVADVDGDGDLDVATANRSADSVSVYVNSGNGTFPTRAEYETSYAPVTCRYHDFDGDGDADLAVANQIGDAVSIFWNSHGVFEGPTTIGAGDTIGHMELEDLNRDGFIDITTSNAITRSLTVLRGAAERVVDGSHAVPSEADAVAVASADLDGDGVSDLIVVHGTSKRISSWKGNGDGSVALIGVWETDGVPTGVALGDFDRDGRIDAAVSQRTGTSVRLYRNTVNGVLSEHHGFSQPEPAVAVECADMDGDASIDVIWTTDGSRVYVGWNDGAGGFGVPVRWTTGGSNTDLALVDIDGDDDLDVVSCRGTGGFNLLRNDGGRAFTPGNTVASLSAVDIQTGDFTGDGVPDVVVTSFSLNRIRVHAGTGVGGFVVYDTYTTPNGPVGLVVADLNGDSRDDILLSCRTDANAALYLGRAGGGLELAGTFAAGLLPSKPVLCDLDQDGVADVVFPQPGTKQFGIMVRAYRPPGPRCPADVDGDAFVDASDFVVLASYFGAPVPPGTLGDLNGDGVVNTADFVMLAADFGCTP